MSKCAHCSTLLATVLLAACASPSGSQVVVVGESAAAGSEAAKEVNNFIVNAEGAGCEAISVGGYAAAAATEGSGEVLAGHGGLLIGIPVLLDCPQGTQLKLDGTRVGSP